MTNKLLSRSICSGDNMHTVLCNNSLWSGTKPWPGRRSRWTLLPPAWISSIARVCVMPCVASPLISTIWSPTWRIIIKEKKSINSNFSTARARMSQFARGRVLCEKLNKALIRNYCTSIKWTKKTYMYPAIFKSGSVLGQTKNEQPHVILFPSSQTEAEASLAAFQLHHKAALLFTRKIVSF